MSDRKISEFPSPASGIPADANLTYIVNGTNYQIPLSEFLSSIGVTGTIENLGPGTPVLDIAGAVNGIRSIQGTNGVNVALGPLEQILISGGGVPDVGTITQVLEAESTATQTPPGLDSPIQVEFGPAQFGPSEPVQLAADGTITVNQTGDYFTFLTFYVTRISQLNQAYPFIRALRNSVQEGNPVALEMSDNESTVPLFLAGFTQSLFAGDVFEIEFVRDGQGSDDASLTSVSSTIGWGSTPSARVSIFKIDNEVTGDAIVEVSSNYAQTGNESVILASGNLDITLIDPATANRKLWVRNISGATTFSAAAGTVETSSLTVGQSVTMVPRIDGWYVI